MQFSTLSIATLAVIASSVVSAESDAFGIINTRSGSKYHFTNWGSDSEGNVIISTLSKNATEFKSLVIEDNTSVQNSDGKYFVVNDDYSISLGDKSDASTGFSIGATEGALTPFNYKGENGYVTCPNDDGDYVIYTQNPSTYSDACSGIASWTS